MKKKESRLQRETRSLLEREIGGVWTKIHGGPFQEPGIADLLGCVCGLHIEIEMKTEGGSLRKTQELRKRRIEEDGGGLYAEARSPEQAVRLVARWLHKHGKASKNSTAWLSSSWRKLVDKTRERRVVRAAGSKLYHLPASKKLRARRLGCP